MRPVRFGYVGHVVAVALVMMGAAVLLPAADAAPGPGQPVATLEASAAAANSPGTGPGDQPDQPSDGADLIASGVLEPVPAASPNSAFGAMSSPGETAQAANPEDAFSLQQAAGLTPYKTVRVLGEIDPLVGLVKVVYDAAGRILVLASSGKVLVYTSNAVLLGTLIAPLAADLFRAGDSVFVLTRQPSGLNQEVRRFNGTTLVANGTWTLGGFPARSPLVGDYLIFSPAGSPGLARLSLVSGVVETVTVTAANFEVTVLPGTSFAVIATASDLVRYDMATNPPSQVNAVPRPGAGTAGEMRVRGADGTSLYTQDGSTLRRIPADLSDLTGVVLDASDAQVAAVATTPNNGGWTLIYSRDSANIGHLYQGVGPSAVALRTPGRLTAGAAWNNTGTGLALTTIPSTGVVDLQLFAAPGQSRPADPFFGGSMGEYTGINPMRALDTRSSIALGLQGPKVNVQVTGIGEVPATGVAAVAVNITVLDATQESYVAAYPAGAEVPNTSSVNMKAGEIRSNLAIVRVGANGQITLYNAAGNTQVLVDIQGFFSLAAGPQGGRFQPMWPQRLFDSRTAGTGPVPTASALPVLARGLLGIPADASAVAVTITAVDPTANTYISAYPNGLPLPTVSNFNPSAGATVANLAMVGIGGDGHVAVYNAVGSTHIVLDVVGYWGSDRSTEAGRYVAKSSPLRRFDTRSVARPLGPAAGISVRMAGFPDDVPVLPSYAEGTGAVVFNLTATQPTEAGYLVVFPDVAGIDPPGSSTVNFGVGQTAASLAVSAVYDNGSVAVFNPVGNTHAIGDVAGFFTSAGF